MSGPIAGPAAAEVFEAQRPRLSAIAYRLLGSVAEAEDILQEVWLAWQHIDLADVRSPAAFLTTATTRRCLDVLRSARMRRETYVGPWLPEPLIGVEDDVAGEVELAESVRMAFLVVLETLSPSERAAFVLHDVFGYGYGELASTLGKGEDACRQLVSRARRHVAARRPRFDTDADAAHAAAERFFAACLGGDLDELLATLHPHAELVTDGGGKVSAARNVIVGPDRVARFFRGVALVAADARLVSTVVNGAPGVIAIPTHAPPVVASVDVEDGRVRRVHLVRNPDKLGHLAR